MANPRAHLLLAAPCGSPPPASPLPRAVASRPATCELRAFAEDRRFGERGESPLLREAGAMGSEAKEMKYRRRGRVPEPVDYGQCGGGGGDRSGVLDWGAALKQDPAELLRKLDELRDQITSEMAEQPRERHRMSRRTVSLRPSPHAEPPPPQPLGRGQEHYRSRYGGGRYGHGLSQSPSEQMHRSMLSDRYARQPSGRFRQWPERQWESSGYIVQGNHHQSSCQCAQCVHGQRAVMQEEHIPMARYFASQQGSHLFDSSPSVSSELDRRSVVSSLYSHFSVSKRRTEYFRKKAESFCRPVRGAAPFVACSSCNQLLQLPPGKCTTRKQIQVQCGSCLEIVSFKLKEVKVHPLVSPTSFPASRTVGSSSRQVNQSFGWYQHQDEGNTSFHKLQAHDRWQQNKDFSDNISLSSASSYDRADKERGSNRSRPLQPVPVRRSRLADSPKDILCQGDAYSQVETSASNTVSPQAPIVEDKRVDPFSSRQKDCSGGDGITSKECILNSIADFTDANFRDKRSDVKYEPKRKDHNEGFRDETVNGRCKQQHKESTSNFCDDVSMGNKYKPRVSPDDTSSLEDGSMSKKYEEKSKQDDKSFQAECTKQYSNCRKEDNNSAIEVETIATMCKQTDIDDCYDKLLSPNSEPDVVLSKIESSVNERTNSSSRVSSEAELDEVQSEAVKNGDSKFFGGFLKKGFKDLSLFNQLVDSAKVSINGHPISERALRKAEKKSGPVSPGSYWYDYRAGFWGVMGHECSGIIPPFIKEFNYAMPKNCAGGNTGVVVNGRELHQKDFELLVKRGLPRISGKSYSVEISGNVIDDTTGKKLRNLGKLAPTVEKMKRGFGMHIPEEIS
uniref:Probable zinc-ribbon domain-containing protein n=1 Tax=Leersia perrieri TaxID=77586 RepID=A0A0D9WKD0_9ORYZ